MPESIAESLTRSLSCGAWPTEGRMSVYVAYSDESGTPNKEGAFLVGGYIGDEKDWPRFSKFWDEEILQSPPAIPYLHMVELRGKKFQKKYGLSEDDVRDKVRNAIEAIRAAGFISGYIGALTRADLKSLYDFLSSRGVKWPKNIQDPDYLCFVAYCEIMIRETAKEHPEVKRINFMVSRKRYVSHHCERFKDAMRDRLNEIKSPLAELVGDLIPLSMEDHKPLQAADVLCWHIQRSYAQTCDATDWENLELLCNSGLTLKDFGKDMMTKLRENMMKVMKGGH